MSLSVLLPMGRKALREVARREEGLREALLCTSFSGFLEPGSRASSQPVTCRISSACLGGYHHEKKGFRL